MDDNIMQLDIESSGISQRNPRRRRPEADNYQNLGNGNVTTISDSSPFADIIGSSPVPPSIPRQRRLATWADEANESLQHLQSVDNNISKPKPNKNKSEKSENEVIPMIPDLEELVDQEFKEKTAQAPNVQINKLISFQDLEKNLLKHSAFTSLDGIDLAPLTHFCLPETQVIEEDVTWNWDNLMSDITSKLMPDNDSNYNQ